MADLSRKRDRERLKIRREPYWQRLAEGAYLGFRRGPDTWLARYRARDGKQQYHALGATLEYDDAKRQAEQWLAQLSHSAVRSVKRGSVKAALEAYLADLKRHGRLETAKDALWRFRQVVYKDRIADLDLEAATRDDFLEWRDRLAGPQPRTINRQVRAVKAALSMAVELGHVGNPDAWNLKPLADDVEEGGETAVFLTSQQRKALIAAASPSAALFLRGLELTGARPRELAAAKVSDFADSMLRLAHRKGRPPKLRVRHVVLSADGVVFFERQIKDKLPGALIFTEDGVHPWRRHIWCREVRAAIAAHNKTAKHDARLPVGIGAYSLRHSRISELLQVHGVDPLTVALQCGTSVAVIERSYMKFIPSALREKLAAVKESA